MMKLTLLAGYVFTCVGDSKIISTGTGTALGTIQSMLSNYQNPPIALRILKVLIC